MNEEDIGDIIRNISDDFLQVAVYAMDHKIRTFDSIDEVRIAFIHYICHEFPGEEMK